MNKELISTLIDKARTSADNAYCPYSNQPVGCGILVGKNVMVGGCNIENVSFGCSAEAGEVALLKAVSEGHSDMRAICFWTDGPMPYPSGKVMQLAAEFNNGIQVIVANNDTFSLHYLYELFPFRPSAADV